MKLSSVPIKVDKKVLAVLVTRTAKRECLPSRILSLGSPEAEATRLNAFRDGLAALGYAGGKNLVIETRWLDGGTYDQLSELAGQLVELKADVIVTSATPGTLAAYAAPRQR